MKDLDTQVREIIELPDDQLTQKFHDAIAELKPRLPPVIRELRAHRSVSLSGNQVVMDIKNALVSVQNVLKLDGQPGEQIWTKKVTANRSASIRKESFQEALTGARGEQTITEALALMTDANLDAYVQDERLNASLKEAAVLMRAINVANLEIRARQTGDSVEPSYLKAVRDVEKTHSELMRSPFGKNASHSAKIQPRQPDSEKQPPQERGDDEGPATIRFLGRW